MKRAKAIEVSAVRAEKERNLEEAFLTRPELAARHRTTVETVKRRQAKGLYTAYKIGRSVRYRLSEIVASENASRVGRERLLPTNRLDMPMSRSTSIRMGSRPDTASTEA